MLSTSVIGLVQVQDRAAPPRPRGELDGRRASRRGNSTGGHAAAGRGGLARERSCRLLRSRSASSALPPGSGAATARAKAKREPSTRRSARLRAGCARRTRARPRRRPGRSAAPAPAAACSCGARWRVHSSRLGASKASEARLGEACASNRCRSRAGTVLRPAMLSHVAGAGKLQVSPNSRPADRGSRSGRRAGRDEQTADGEGVVADHLGVEPERGPARASRRLSGSLLDAAAA